MLQTLDEREQEIIRRRYGLQLRDREREPLELVGESIGVTRERVRQIEQKALSKLRHPHISSIMGHDEYSPMETKTQAEIIADRQLSLEKRLQSLEINAPAILKARDQLVDDVVTLFSFGDWGAVLKSLGSFNTSGRLNMMTAVAKELNISMSFTELSQLAHEMAEIIDPYELFTKAEAFSDMQSREKGDYSYTYAHQVMIREHMTQLIAEALRISEEN